MNLIALDRRAALEIKQHFRLSNYHMLWLGWAIGLLTGFALAFILNWAGSFHTL